MQENEKNSFSHPPSAAELMEVYAADCQEPQSPFYKRVLVRPRLSVVRLLALVIASLAVCVGVALAVFFSVGKAWPAVIAGMGALLLLCLIHAKRLLIALVKIYQATAPASLRKRCRYEPSCSVYMIAVVEKYGFWRGALKGLRRWHGCKPPNGGYDFP